MPIHLAASNRWRRVVLLVALGLAVRVSGLGLHSLDHQPGVGFLMVLVFDAATHAEDTAHLEAGEVVIYVGCPACLLLHSGGDVPWLATAPSSIPRAQNPAVESKSGCGDGPTRQFDSRAPPVA